MLDNVLGVGGVVLVLGGGVITMRIVSPSGAVMKNHPKAKVPNWPCCI